MDNSAIVEQIVQNLSFEVEAVPKNKAVKLLSSSISTPLNIKIRVRKKDDIAMHRGIISIPIFDDSDKATQKVRLVNSDQTIMSFDVVMEAEFEKKRKPRKHLFEMFRPGICLGASDDDDAPYTPSASYSANITDGSTNSKSDGVLKHGFTLSKNTYEDYGDKGKYFLGKCKPGGCLDPPFGEDKYSYRPNPQKPLLTEQSIVTKEEINDSDEKYKDRHRSIFDSGIFKKKRKTSDRSTGTKGSISIKENQSNSILDLYQVASNVNSLSTTHSNSIITYPPVLTASELPINDKGNKSRMSSEDKSRKSFNEFNPTDAYFIPPKSINKKRDKKKDVETDLEGNKTRQSGTSKMLTPIPIPIPLKGISKEKDEKEDIETNLEINKTSHSVTSKMPIPIPIPIPLKGISKEKDKKEDIETNLEINKTSHSDTSKMPIPIPIPIPPKVVSNERNKKKDMDTDLGSNKSSHSDTLKMPIPIPIPIPPKGISKERNKNKDTDTDLESNKSSHSDTLKMPIPIPIPIPPKGISKERNKKKDMDTDLESNKSSHSDTLKMPIPIPIPIPPKGISKERNKNKDMDTDLESNKSSHSDTSKMPIPIPIPIPLKGISKEKDKKEDIETNLEINKTSHSDTSKMPIPIPIPIPPKVVSNERNKKKDMDTDLGSNKSSHSDTLKMPIPIPIPIPPKGISKKRNKNKDTDTDLESNKSSHSDTLKMPIPIPIPIPPKGISKERNKKKDMDTDLESNKSSHSDTLKMPIPIPIPIPPKGISKERNKNKDMDTDLESNKSSHSDTSKMPIPIPIPIPPKGKSKERDKTKDVGTDLESNKSRHSDTSKMPIPIPIPPKGISKERDNKKDMETDLESNETSHSDTSKSTIPILIPLPTPLFIKSENAKSKACTSKNENFDTPDEGKLKDYSDKKIAPSNVAVSQQEFDEKEISSEDQNEIEDKEDIIDHCDNTKQHNNSYIESYKKTLKSEQNDAQIADLIKNTSSFNETRSKINESENPLDTFENDTFEKIKDKNDTLHEKDVENSESDISQISPALIMPIVLGAMLKDADFVESAGELLPKPIDIQNDINNEDDNNKDYLFESGHNEDFLKPHNYYDGSVRGDRSSQIHRPIKDESNIINQQLQSFKDTENITNDMISGNISYVTAVTTDTGSKQFENVNSQTNLVHEDYIQIDNTKPFREGEKAQKVALKPEGTDFVDHYNSRASTSIIKSTNDKGVTSPDTNAVIFDATLSAGNISKSSNSPKELKSLSDDLDNKSSHFSKSYGSTSVSSSIPSNSTLKSALKKDIVTINLGFQSYINEKNERVLKTFDTDLEPERYTNDSITLVKSQMRLSANEIRMSVDSENDMFIQIKKASINQHVHISDTNFENLVDNKLKEKLAQPRDSISHREIIDRELIHDSLLKIYDQELVPLQMTIKTLQEEIDILATQQMLFSEKIFSPKKTKPPRVINTNRRCGCLKKV